MRVIRATDYGFDTELRDQSGEAWKGHLSSSNGKTTLYMSTLDHRLLIQVSPAGLVWGAAVRRNWYFLPGEYHTLYVEFGPPT